LDKIVFTVLGCGASGGVPRLGNNWGACNPKNIKNQRLRCSLLVEKKMKSKKTVALIDTGPDMRQQLLKAKVEDLDGIIYTHSHADHVHGIDDLRMLVFKRRARLPVYADKKTSKRLKEGFGYIFKQPKGSNYPAILDLKKLDKPTKINGPAGEIIFEPLEVKHGETDALGFKIGNLAYIPDVSEIYQETWEKILGIDVLIIDALRYDPHPSHSHLSQTLEWIKRLKPKKTYLINLNIELDYEKLSREVPENVSVCYDMLRITQKII
tara:strand:- start:749 stop:1549 length:801 start_codon:yes stop_codon:yes gene_type:complete